MEKWTQLVEYINKKNIGDILYRQEILTVTDEKRHKGNTTTDNFRLWLVHCNYLETVEMGKYKLLKYIDTKLTSNELKKLAYNQEYRINNDRFEKLKIILEDKK